MKTLILSLFVLFSANAQAATVVGEDNVQLYAGTIEGHASIPRVGALTGSVVSVYAGSAYALETYVVTVGNTDAPCEGDDCIAQKSFTLNGAFKEPVKTIYSRQLDKNTYSIALLTTVVKMKEDGTAVYQKSKILLRVKFHAAGVESEAEMKVIAL